MFDFIGSLTDWINDVSANWWFLAIIFVIAYLDSVVPIVPSETTVIIGGVAAGQGHHLLVAVIAAGAVGAFLGDNTAYTIGHRFRPWLERRAADRPKLGTRLEWAGAQLKSRGGPLLITARFIPGGRTALTLSSGATAQPRPWFAKWVAVAAVLWAGYAAGLGWWFGDRFKDDHTKAFWLAFGSALGITVLIEGIRYLRHRRTPAAPAVPDSGG